MTTAPGSADRPKPWFGCDPNGRAWIAYCEAWSNIYVRRSRKHLDTVEAHRGKDGLADLLHNIQVVKDDYAGKIEDRATIPTLLRL